MGQIIIQIADDRETEVINAICTLRGYQDSMGTKKNFVRFLLAEFLKSLYIQQKQVEAAEQARINSKTIDIS
jgi:hypothetical protein